MEEEGTNEYLVQLEKLMTSEVAATYWAPNMDILAITTFDNLLELYRINYKAQKVFQVEQNKTIKSMAFSPDSQLIAYGLIDGTIKILKTENGERIVVVEGVHSTEIQNLSFMPFCTLDSDSFLPFQKNSIESRLIVNISPHKNCNKNAIIKINYFSQMRLDFTLLLSSEKGRTLLLVNGFIPVASIDYSSVGFRSPRAIYSHLDKRIMSIVAEDSGSHSRLTLVQFQAAILGEMQEDLIKYNCLIAYINEIILFVEVTYDAAEALVRDIIRQYNSKINLIDDPNNEGLSPCEELFKFLNCGITSTAIVNFLTKEVYDSKILEKLDETLNGIFGQLHDLLLESVQNSLEKATVLFKRLLSFTKIKKFAVFGVSPSDLEKIQERILRLYTMGEVLLVESTEAKFDIRNLLVWLNKATIKSSVQNQVEIENTKSYLNKYTVDFNRLYTFLSHQPHFQLSNLLLLFSSQPTPIKLSNPDFRLLTLPSHPPKENPQREATLSALSKLFEVQDVQVGFQKMVLQQSFRGFKSEVKDLLSEWKNLTSIPVKKISQLVSQKFQKYDIGTIGLSELFQFQVKTIVRNGELLIFYVQREQGTDRLVQYNCHQRTRGFVESTAAHILSIAVAESIIVVLEHKSSLKKTVVQVVNEQFDGSQIQVGKIISKVEGELDIDSSLRGLNSLVIDKNKLIIFD